MKKRTSFLILVCLIFTLTGCWDVQDITNRAYITALGLDYADEGEPDEYKVTFEIVQPELLNNQNVRKASIVHSVNAISIGAAIEKLQARIPHPLSLAHNRVVLLGERLAKERNFKDFADFFQKNPNIQMRVRLMVVQDGEASDILDIQPIYGKYVARELVSMFEVNYPLAKNTAFFHFLGDLHAHNGRALVGRALVVDEGQAVLRQGGGVYDNWRLVGWLNSVEVRNANWFVGSGTFIVDSKDEGSIYTYMVDKKSVKIIPIEENGSLSFVVKVKTEGPLAQEQGEHLDASDPKVLAKLEKLFERTIKEQIESAIVKAQDFYRVDYLGFDTALQQNKPELYKKLEWEQTFPVVPVKVEVEVNVARFGLGI